METSISHFSSIIEEARIARKKLYPLEEILLVGLCAIICGAEGFQNMALFGRAIAD